MECPKLNKPPGAYRAFTVFLERSSVVSGMMKHLMEKLDCQLNSRQIWPHLILAIRHKHNLMLHHDTLFLKRWFLISETKIGATVELGTMEYCRVF